MCVSEGLMQYLVWTEDGIETTEDTITSSLFAAVDEEKKHGKLGMKETGRGRSSKKSSRKAKKSKKGKKKTSSSRSSLSSASSPATSPSSSSVTSPKASN